MMRCGIEYEYLLVDVAGETAGRIRDFGNLRYEEIAAWLDDKPGRADPALATGDLGIKSGYWYLEGDERFHPDGRFRTLMVKGVEIRTPPADSVAQAMQRLLEIEKQLAAQLAGRGLGLAIAAFNPRAAGYAFDPPLNAWERELRGRHRGYDGSLISTLSYGPDINLSMPGWTPQQSLDAARKLNYYAPWLTPFSFHSPFAANAVWPGFSKRSFERCLLRPAVKLYLSEAELAALPERSALAFPARIPGEAGRIEFKAFDAMPTPRLLAACCHLLVGVCLAEGLHGRSEQTDPALYQRAARVGFGDETIVAASGQLLEQAERALRAHGQADAADALQPLHHLLEQRRTPAHGLLDFWRQTGLMHRSGGHAG